MKKTLQKIIIALTIVVIVASCSTSSKIAKTNNNALIGTWQYCNQDGTPIINRFNQENIATYKIYSNTNYTVADVGLANKKIFRNHIGSYAIDNDQITESVGYVDAGWKNIKGKKYIYKFKIDNDLLTISNEDEGIKEVWKKVGFLIETPN